MDEQRLLSEMRRHPILYDKTMDGHKKPALRDRAWADIAVAVGVEEELCRRRWRTLRDTYIKEVRAREAGTTRNKKKRWHWYQHMAFMLPHVGSVVCVEDSSDPLFCVKTEATPHEGSACASTEDYLVTTSFEGNEGSAPRLKEEGEMDTAQDPVLGWVDDPDAQFLISYLPTFKRLTPRQNALARLKIQQVLYQVEFGDL